MKRQTILKCFLLFAIVFSIPSCDKKDDTFTIENTDNSLEEGQDITTRLMFDPVRKKENYTFGKNEVTLEEYWINDTVEINTTINSDVPTNNIAKIEFYLIGEEEDGYNTTAPFDTNGKIISTMTTIPESGEFTLSIPAIDAYNLYSDDFIDDRSSSFLAKEKDFFQLEYVITSTDGTILVDSRTSILDRISYPISIKFLAAPPIFEGLFDFEWLYTSPGMVDNPFDIVLAGDTGQVDITLDGPSTSGDFYVYSLDNLLLDFFNESESDTCCSPYPGKLYYNYSTGVVDVKDTTWVELYNHIYYLDFFSVTWFIYNINGSSLDVDFTYYYSDSHDQRGTFRLTRTDGDDWPTNLHEGDFDES